MSVNSHEIRQIALVARAFIEKLQAATAIADTSGDIPVLADFPDAGSGAYTTTATIAALINRYFDERDPKVDRQYQAPGPMPTT